MEWIKDDCCKNISVVLSCSQSLQTILQQRSQEIATTRGRWARATSVFKLGFLVSQTKDPAERTKLKSQNFVPNQQIMTAKQD